MYSDIVSNSGKQDLCKNNYSSGNLIIAPNLCDLKQNHILRWLKKICPIYNGVSLTEISQVNPDNETPTGLPKSSCSNRNLILLSGCFRP